MVAEQNRNLVAENLEASYEDFNKIEKADDTNVLLVARATAVEGLRQND